MNTQIFDPFILFLSELFCASLLNAVDSRILFHINETKSTERKLDNLFRTFNSYSFVFVFFFSCN